MTALITHIQANLLSIYIFTFLPDKNTPSAVSKNVGRVNGFAVCTIAKSVECRQLLFFKTDFRSFIHQLKSC